MRNVFIVLVLVLLISACEAEVATDPEPAEEVITGRLPSSEGASAYIIEPSDGAVISGGEVRVVFGLTGMGVAPAGVNFSGAGHHHILVDVAELPDLDMPIPADSNHVHFGLGQTEAILTLSPGPHTLQLLLGDHRHIPHDPPVASAVVSITVE